MNGWLRSWKICEVCPHILDGVAGWKKRRLRRAGLLIPPGNIFLSAIHSGCRMHGADWADQEVAVFKKAHDDVAAARRIDNRTIWLPHLPGVELRKVRAVTASSAAAFTELGRFHHLGEIHGDPHAGNFLYDGESGRCRIIDFETASRGMNPAQGRARDFAILALDLWKHEQGFSGDFLSWREAYGGDEKFCPIGRLFRNPGLRLRQYWKWLGYTPPVKEGGGGAEASMEMFLVGQSSPAGQFQPAAPRTVAVSAQAEGEESPDTTGQRAS